MIHDMDGKVKADENDGKGPRNWDEDENEGAGGGRQTEAV